MPTNLPSRKAATPPERRLPSITEAWAIYRKYPLRISCACVLYSVFDGLLTGVVGFVFKPGLVWLFGRAGVLLALPLSVGASVIAIIGLQRFLLACMKPGVAPAFDLLVPDGYLSVEALKGGALQILVLYGAVVSVGVSSAMLAAGGHAAFAGSHGFAWWLFMVVGGGIGLGFFAVLFWRLVWSWMLWQQMLTANRAGWRKAFAQSNALVWTMPGKLFLLLLRLCLLNTVGAMALGIGLLVTMPVTMLALYCACRTLVGIRKVGRLPPPGPAWKPGAAMLGIFGALGLAFGVVGALAGTTLVNAVKSKTAAAAVGAPYSRSAPSAGPARPQIRTPPALPSSPARSSL